MKQGFDEQSAIKIAYFRFALIAPVIQGTFADLTKTAYYRRITENELTLPDGRTVRYNPKTLEKWEEYYRKSGMDGLMPKKRSDAGKSRRTYLVHIVDDHSRLIVGARFFYNDNAYNFQQVLKDAISRYGLCNKLYLDHGSPYDNNQLALICGSLGIVKIHAPVRDGAAKAKVERSFRTIKDTWLYGFDPSGVSSLEELNQLLAQYVRRRNTSVNRSIGETPVERYQKGMGQVRAAKSSDWLDECFMNRVTRRVNLDATLSIDGVYYDVPMEFIRSKVEARYLPDRMSDAYIYFEGKHYPIRATSRVENGRTRRNNTHAIDYSKMGGSFDV